MKIETKFGLGDTVYPISKHGNDKFVKCETCNGAGVVTINSTNKEITCPDCYGRGGRTEWVPERWQLWEGFGVIGKVDIELYSKKYEDYKDEYRYMVDSTGVGCGISWDESNLFLTREEALKECEKRNKEENLS